MPPVIPSTAPADYASLIAEDRAALLELLAEVDGEDWDRSTACPGWSVLDLGRHLVGVDLGVLARDRDGYYGTPVPAEIEDEKGFVAFIDRLNEQWVEATRRLSPPLIVDLLRWTGRQLVDLYRNQDPTAQTAKVSWASDHPVPKWLDQGRELTERWVHHQQIRHGLAKESLLEPDVTGAVLDVFSWAYPYRLSASPRPAGTAVEVVIDGAVERRWRFVSDGIDWIAASESQDPSVRLQVDADDAWRLLSGGLGVEDLPVPDPNHDLELAQVLVRTRAVIVLPED